MNLTMSSAESLSNEFSLKNIHLTIQIDFLDINSVPILLKNVEFNTIKNMSKSMVTYN